MPYFVYWIRSERSNYIGATVSLVRRLRQHNGEIKGGAKRTRNRVWYFYRIISGFRTWREALQFEWAFKHHCRRCRCQKKREEALVTLMNKERWTNNSPLASEVDLKVHTCLNSCLAQG